MNLAVTVAGALFFCMSAVYAVLALVITPALRGKVPRRVILSSVVTFMFAALDTFVAGQMALSLPDEGLVEPYVVTAAAKAGVLLWFGIEIGLWAFRGWQSPMRGNGAAEDRDG